MAGLGSNANYDTRVDEASSTITYVGKATRGTLTSADKWQIKKIDTSSGCVITWASGFDKFEYVWDDRATYF